MRALPTSLWVGYELGGVWFDGAFEFDDSLKADPDLVALETGAVIVDKVVDADEARSDFRLRSLVDLIRVSLLMPAFCRYRVWNDGANTVHDRRLFNERGGSWIEYRKLEVGELELLKRQLRRWLQYRDALEAPLTSFERAICAPSPAETVAWTISSMESMLTFDSPESAVYRLRLRTALAATDDIEERRAWFGRLGLAYDVRSKVMHGDSAQTVSRAMEKLAAALGGDERAAATQMLELFRAVCMGVVDRLQRGQSLHTFVQELDRALLATPELEASNILEFPVPAVSVRDAVGE